MKLDTHDKNSLTVAEKVAKMLLEIKAITLSPQAPYRFTSGILSPIYTDNRLLMGYPLKRREITGFMANLIKERNLKTDLIAGTSTAGIPPAAWLADLLNLPMVYVRGEKKEHGKGRQVEGVMARGSRVLLVEDLISTGKSSLSAVEAIRREGGKIDTCIAFFNYGLSEAVQKYRDLAVNLYTLTTLDIVLAVAQQVSLIGKKEADIVFAWQKDPIAWEKSMRAKEEKPTEY
ncbi:orotate phosphoribosyltransferase [Candidatus Microgenomates bacterium]|nr:orotate phosphoribosyltransferase [Candidatus Microgenomates bacterium]